MKKYKITIQYVSKDGSKWIDHDVQISKTRCWRILIEDIKK